MREKKLSRLTKTGSAALVSSVIGMMTVGAAFANDKLVELQKDEANWVMQGKNYSADHYSTSKQINKKNVSKLAPSWTFSTGVLSGHEGAPLVVGDMMYIHSPFPNNTFAINLNDPGTIVWEHKPKQDPAARAVACCDVVNRGLAYWPGDDKTPAMIVKSQLDGHVVALNAETGELHWQVENGDISVGQTQTQAPFVVKDLVIQGSSGAELGVRGYVTAFDIHTGEMAWRWYATGPDSEIGLAKDFNSANPHYGQKRSGPENLGR